MVSKEASENMIELHDDDPEHFEILLKYIYTYTYDKLAIEKLSSGAVSRRIAVPIGVYAVANKYDVLSIYNPIINDVQTLLVGVGGAGWQKIDASMIRLKTALHSYYEATARPQGPLTKMLVEIVIVGRRNFNQSAEYEQL
ncbi:hypothetical protein E8E11_001488 [Didymella keratinophila]|nr:hypothetical protein E8E11_001488 [Didymella keratinophila]